MFTHNPTTTGRTKAPLLTLAAEDEGTRRGGVESVPATTLTVHALPERPYVYGRSSAKAKAQIVIAYMRWMEMNPHPSE